MKDTPTHGKDYRKTTGVTGERTSFSLSNWRMSRYLGYSVHTESNMEDLLVEDKIMRYFYLLTLV